MAKKKVTIVGVGALGSHAALALRNAADLKVVDFDKIEAKNVLSQFHTKMSIGQNKAKATGSSFQGLFGIRLDFNTNRVTKDNVEAILGGSDLVIDCTDNYAARRVISDFVRATNTPCLHGALSANGDFARVMWNDLFLPDEEGEPGKATCEDGVNLPFHVLVGAHVAQVAQAFLTTGKMKSLQLTPYSLVSIT